MLFPKMRCCRLFWKLLARLLEERDRLEKDTPGFFMTYEDRIFWISLMISSQETLGSHQWKWIEVILYKIYACCNVFSACRCHLYLFILFIGVKASTKSDAELHEFSTEDGEIGSNSSHGDCETVMHWWWRARLPLRTTAILLNWTGSRVPFAFCKNRFAWEVLFSPVGSWKKRRRPDFFSANKGSSTSSPGSPTEFWMVVRISSNTEQLIPPRAWEQRYTPIFSGVK